MKKFLTSLVILFCLASLRAGDAWWKFDENNNGIIVSTEGINAVINGSPAGETYLVEALYGMGAYFDNASWNLDVEHCQAVNLINDFGMEFTFKPELVDSYRTLFWKGRRDVSPQRIQYYISIHDGKLEFKYKDAVAESTTCVICWLVFTINHSNIRTFC